MKKIVLSLILASSVFASEPKTQLEADVRKAGTLQQCSLAVGVAGALLVANADDKRELNVLGLGLLVLSGIAQVFSSYTLANAGDTSKH